MADLKELLRKRSAVKGKITNFRNKLKEFTKQKIVTSSNINELTIRLSKFESAFHDFDELRDQIELLTEDSNQLSEHIAIENDFFELINFTQEFIHSRKQGVSVIEDRSSNSSCQVNIKLPQIQLPTFDGNYSKWLEFRDTYKSIVHENTTLNEISKFHYLRTSLEGSAAIVIQSLEISADNYNIAWKLICDRYDSKGQLINNHLQALLNIEQLVKESDTSLRNVIDHLGKNLRALKSLGEPTDSWDTLIVFMFASKLDPITLRKWEEHKTTLSDSPKLNEFVDFLRRRADVLESLSRSSSHPEKPEKIIQKKLDKNQKSFVASASATPTTNLPQMCCLICKGDHRIFNCKRFLDMLPENRCNEIYKLKVCPNCFRGGHRAYQCRAIPCKTCGRKHNSLLHRTYVPNNNQVASTSQASESHSCDHKVNNACPVSLSSCTATQVLLSTALVEIKDRETDQRHSVRALLDCGSESSFITKTLQQRLRLPVQDCKPVDVTGINKIGFTAMQRCKIEIQSKDRSIQRPVHCIVIEQIANDLPSNEVDISLFDIPKNVKLADTAFHRPSPVELLLGADIFWELITQGQIALGKGKPVLQNSHFGWLVVGPTTCHNTLMENNKINCNFSHEISVQLERFWKLEELPQTDKWTQEEEACEAHFVENTYRLPDGRFCVSLPLKENPEKLGESFNIAFKRLHSLEKRFIRQPHVKEQYCAFIKEYEDLGHLTEIDKPDVANFLPHHPVLREKSVTTKCRAVYDASSKTTSGLSLNDIMMVGPTIQDDIFSILIRFRQHKYVLVGDIEKMYRQILVNENDRYLQVILWRENSTETLRYLRLNTVTYGTASAPFLSIRCLFEIAKACKDTYIQTIIEKDMFVDDLVTGSDSQEQLRYILDSVSTTLAEAQMNLRKIKSNCTHLFENDSKFAAQPNVEFNKECTTLGLKWNPTSDKILISCSKEQDNNEQLKCTKRTILSTTASIFDPLGLLCVCTIVFKILLQRLWTLKLDWDDEVPTDIKTLWNKIVQGLSTLCTFQIDRCVLYPHAKRIILHCFSDASLKAFSACLYIHTASDNEMLTRLICAKAKVAPLKPTTIPRLELLGALLASRLYDKVKGALRCKIDEVHFWTDSKIVLAWLNIYRTNKLKLKTFVAHRVSEASELSRGAVWRYVPSAQNPADLASRGLLPEELTSADLWWKGPAFLQGSEADWPSQDLQVDSNSDIPEVKSTIKAMSARVNHNSELIKMENYSTFNKLRRTVAYILRFVNNCRNRLNKIQGPLNVHELQTAELNLAQISQSNSFPEEINSLKNNVPLHKKSKLISLNPFINKTGVMHVGGRLDNSNFSYEKKHPIILDAHCHFSKLICEHFHLQLKHTGPQLLHSSIREEYWIIGGRMLARNVYRKCVTCKRLRGAVATQIMGNLPAQRVTPGFPFEIVGIDYAGPFYILSKKGRGAHLIKTFLCIMCCLKTKAVHLEISSDLSTQCFILALRRFIARRGKPREIFSDNGRNFVGASKEVGQFLSNACNSVSEVFANEGIQFRFSPAYSPHFGGLFEAAVKSAKYHITRIVGNMHFTFEELATVFAQVEAILNSRPLFPLSSDPDDLSPLSPGHFLIGRPLTSLPAPDFEHANPNQLHRYAQMEQVRQHFWTRWSQEYIAELQQRTKWRNRQPNLKPGQLVLIRQSQCRPLNWPLGRIVELHKGTDGLCRVVDVRQQKGIVRRAISSICPLLDDEDETEPTNS